MLFIEYDALVVLTPLTFLQVIQAVRTVLILRSRKLDCLVFLYFASSMAVAAKPRRYHINEVDEVFIVTSDDD